MKTILILAGIAVAGVLGYMVEPTLRKTLTGNAGNATQSESAAVPGIDPASLDAAQLPKTVALKTEAKFTDPDAGLALTVAAGSKVNLLRVEGTNAIVTAPKTDFPITIPISQTDLHEQLAAKPTPPPAAPAPAPVPAPAAPAPAPAPAAAAAAAPAAPAPAAAAAPAPAAPAAPAPAAPAAPAPAPAKPAAPAAPAPAAPATPAPAAPAPAKPATPAPAAPAAPATPAPAAPAAPAPAAPAKPAAPAAPAPAPAPAKPAVPAAPAAAPAPAKPAAPATAPTPAAAAAAQADVVKIMQASISAKQIKEFDAKQVTNWAADADETIDGQIYQTGLVTYKAETIFGVKSIQARALIKDGKVVRWIWPKSGVEIK